MKPIAIRLGKDIACGVWAGIGAGLTSALFLFVLGQIDIQFRNHIEWVFLLPLTGLLSAGLYRVAGGNSNRGTKLVVESIHEPDLPIPLRMAPLVLVGTWLTHVGGGSAGREGTAVQMGGAVALVPARLFKLGHLDRRRLVMAGIAGGFGAVFGTPIAGAIFGIEATSKRWFEIDSLLICAVSAFTGDLVCRSCRIEHHAFSAFSLATFEPWAVIPVGVVCAVLAHAFLFSMHGLQKFTREWLWWTIPVAGGGLLILMTMLSRDGSWNGLSLPLLYKSTQVAVLPWDFAAKLLFTVVTLGFGFKGGEVTPLFVIGATAANALAQACGLPVAPCAMIGFVTLFAGCSGAPLACALMAGELFGWMAAPWAFLASVVAVMIGPADSLYGIRRPWMSYFRRSKWSNFSPSTTPESPPIH